MFKKMSNLIRGEDQTEYDPHLHRDVTNTVSYAQTMTHMLKGCIGAGVLAMPNAISRLGIILGPLAIIFIAVFTTYCIQLLILGQYELCKKHRLGYIPYPHSMRLAVKSGPPCFRWTAEIFGKGVDVILVFWQIGLCGIYCVFVAENMKQILDFYGYNIGVRLLIIYTYPVQFPLSMIKDLKLLAPCSSVSNGCTFIGLLMVGWYIIEYDIVMTEDMVKVKGLLEIPVFIGITLFALQAVGVVLSLEYNMERPARFTGICGLFTIGMVIITILYVILGLFGYLRFGSEAKGSVTLNLPKEDKKAQASVILYATAIFLSFPLQNYVAWEILYFKVKKKWGEKRTVDYFLRILCLTLPFALAVAAPSLGPFMGLAGALCLSMVAVVFPAVMDMSIYYPDRYGPAKYKLILDIGIILFGIFACASGVYTSLLEMAAEI